MDLGEGVGQWAFGFVSERGVGGSDALLLRAQYSCT